MKVQGPKKNDHGDVGATGGESFAPAFCWLLSQGHQDDGIGD